MSARDWIVSTVGEPAFTQLAERLPGSELQSLLLEVMRERARARTPAEVLAQYRRDRFVQPAAVDLRTQLAVDGELLAAAGEFQAIELSPLAPLATCSSMALTDQHRTVAAVRGTEVVSETTLYMRLSETCPVNSRVTLDDGRVSTVITAARRDGGGWPTPDHLEVTLT